MKKIITLILTALLFTSVSAQESGVLLGFRSQLQTVPNPEAWDPEPAHKYFTVWVYPSADGYKYALGPKLLVPRDDGFWEVGVKRQNEKSWVEDHLFAYPVLNPKMPLEGPPLDTSGHVSRRITFAGPTGISVLVQSDGYSQGAAHPWHNRQLEMLDPAKLVKPMSIKSLLGAKGFEELQSAAKSYRASHPERKEQLESQVRDTAWGISRNPGRWLLSGFLSYSAEVYRGSYATFGLPSSIPNHHDTLSISMKAIKAKIPGAKDAFQGPNGSPIAIVTEQHIHIFDSLDQPKADLVVDLGAPSTPVMSEWAVGSSNVKRWTGSVMDFVGADI